MDRRRLTRVAFIGAAAFSAAACAQQQSRIAPVSHSNSFAYTAADRECLARAMYFESNRSSSDGMLAVGSIVANRVQSGRYGSTVCQVVGAKRQFAPGVLSRTMSGPSADLARSTADQVLAGKRHVGVKSAMHFHTAGMRFPYPNMHYVLVAGGNAFYEKRDSSGGGRAANARSLAIALAHAKVDSQPIQVAAATPLEAPIPPAVSTGSVPLTIKGAPSGQVAVVTQVAAVQPAAPAPVPAARVAAAPAAKPQTTVVAAAAPVPTPRQAPVAVAAAPAPRQQVAAVAPRKAAPAPQVVAAPVAYAQADAPAVDLPKIRPAPKRVLKVEQAEPALASIAPVKAKHSAKAAPVEAAAPVQAEAPTPVQNDVAANHIASAFDAFK